jgi:hypothetical protein
MPITQILLTAAARATYTLTPDYYNPNEGIALNFYVGGSGITDGIYYWDITNSGTTNDDFTAISGTVTVTNNSGSFTITPTADGTTEGNETFIVALRNGAGTILASSGTITIQPVTPIMSLIADDYAGSGTTWADSSGLGSTCTLVNTPVFANTSPKHFTFDRNSLEYVQGPVLGNLSRWSIESWFRISEPLSNMPTTALITTTYQIDGGNLYGVINYTFSNYSTVDNSALTLGFFNNATWYNTSGFVPAVDTWYHVIGTYDGTTLKQYVNGALNSNLSVTATTIANGGPVRIGRRWDGAAQAQHYFSGDIATAKIYNGALTATEVAAAFNSSRATYLPTYTLTPAANNVNEGESLTFTVGGTNITDGTYYWATDANETDISTRNGNVTVTSNAGTFSITPNADARTDGASTITVTLRSGSITGNILANSTVTVNDTSLAP